MRRVCLAVSLAVLFAICTVLTTAAYAATPMTLPDTSAPQLDEALRTQAAVDAVTE